ncbi:hypothetical protein SAY87_021090 [Trapa incisa]|uniref:Glyoxylate/hydroxypyruvate reductase HPR3 n=1 Tax=Trapa incisa TaxID=236973 RepID=A0AAN7JRM9_9MYRT|nr:hypothetical protein SAY87_021090 [Trapa incisa]
MASTQESPNGTVIPLPHVLLLRYPAHFSHINYPLPDHLFHLLKPWESPLPLDQFVLAHARSAQAVVTTGGISFHADLMSMMPDLRLIVTTSAGLDHIDLAECRRRGIAIACAGDVYSEVVADLAVGLLLDLWRKVSAANRYVRAGRWARDGDFPLGSKLGGKRVGIVGLGSIGTEVAKRLEAFGCIISYNSRKEKPSVSFPFYTDVLDLASNSDALVICCGLTPETHHMINREVMTALGKDGVIVNIGRGAIVDEKEMVQLLVSGELGGAGLDVFENEPHFPQDLIGLDNVVLSPHCAAFTPESFFNMCQLVVGNLEAFFSNKPLLSPVALEEV